MLAAALFLLARSACAPAPHAAPPTAQGQARTQAQARPEFAAHALDSTLSWAEFDELVLNRHAMSEAGRAALKHLIRARLLDRLATESKLVVPEADIDRRSAEIEKEMAASGEAKTLDEYLAKSHITRAIFRDFLRLAIVQETLARRALGLPPDKAINAEQQELWLDQIVEQRGSQSPPPPWPDGVAGRCGDIAVSASEFLAHLELQIEDTQIRDDCFQALLAKRMRARMPDLSAEANDRAIDAELARRRADVEREPKYKGMKFEQIMAAQGVLLDSLRRDPAIVVSALAHVWVDRTYGDDGLRRVYADERGLFDKRYGEAYETRVLFLRAAKLTNQLNPRSYEDAEGELRKLLPLIKTRADFERLAKTRSEDVNSRDKGGLLGFVAPGDENAPESLRAAIFQGEHVEGEHCVGPVRLANGVLLAWVGARRPAPGWDVMSQHVHNDLRRRFMDECLLRKDMVTYLDEE
jgi:hypothetical protein